MGRSITSFVERLSVVMVYVSAACVAFMMVIGVADTLFSKLANRPLPGYFELTAASMVLIIFLPLSYVQMKRRHLAMTALTDLLPERLKLTLDLLANVIALIAIGFVTWAGFKGAVKSLQVMEFYPGSIPFPLYPWKFALVLGAGVFMVKLLVDAVRAAHSLAAQRKART